MAKERASERAMRLSEGKGSTAVAKPASFMPVPIAESTQSDAVDILAMLPENVRSKVEVFDSTLPASPVWSEPGQFLEGEFVTIRADVGPNKSKIYELLIAKKGRPQLVALWGSTNLDQQMERARPNPGDRLLIVYRGEQDTQRKMNPVKLFDVAVIRKEA